MEMLWKLNPWWESRSWSERDKHLVEYRSMRVRWIPRWTEKISLRPFSLNFVIGPRQVGKTTGLKLLIENLLKRLEDSFQLIYMDLELFTNLKEFRDAIMYYLGEREKNGSIIILDEVSYLKEWYRIVKGFIDLGEFKNDVIIATGSSSINIFKHAESFVGRRGGGKDVFVLPLSFPEFAKVMEVNTKREEKVIEAFKTYKETGGFPKSINHAFSEDEFVKSFEREIANLGRSADISKKIFAALLNMLPSALSYHAIAKKIGISHKTVESYIENFRDLFLVEVAYWRQGNRVSFRKEKKIFFRDPFILNTFSFWTGKKFLESTLYEGIVQEHMLRKFGEVYYYRNSYEIDCIAGNLKVEIKAGKPHRRYPRKVLVLEEEDIPGFLVELYRERA